MCWPAFRSISPLISRTTNTRQILLALGLRSRLLDGQSRDLSGPSARASCPHPTFSSVPRRVNTARPRHVLVRTTTPATVKMSLATTRFPRSDLSDRSSQASAFNTNIPSLPLDRQQPKPKPRLSATLSFSSPLGNNGQVMARLEHCCGA